MPKRSQAPQDKTSAKKPKTQPWFQGLAQSMKDPNSIVKSDEQITVIKDMYPKAKFHYLVLPNKDISSLKNVSDSDLDLLKHMDKIARDLASGHNGHEFKIGYHAEPSMARLHLHVISDDFTAGCLKTKKHWNSFTTDFFLKSEDVINSLEETGKVELPSKDSCKKSMETALKCHKCSFTPKNMPELKKHIESVH